MKVVKLKMKRRRTETRREREVDATPQEVVRSADLVDYTAEEGLRALGQGKLLNSDSFPGADRNKLCMVSKVPLGVAGATESS